MIGDKKMVSYKKLYEELLEKTKKQENVLYSTGYKCPLCEAEIVLSVSEFICTNENCSYDKTTLDVFYAYAELRDYEEI